MKGAGRLEIVGPEVMRVSLRVNRYWLGILLAVPMIVLGFGLTILLEIGSGPLTIVIIAVCLPLSLHLTRKKKDVAIERDPRTPTCLFTDKTVFLRFPDNRWLGINAENMELVAALQDFEGPADRACDD
jgi:hypothetical protein